MKSAGQLAYEAHRAELIRDWRRYSANFTAPPQWDKLAIQDQAYWVSVAKRRRASHGWAYAVVAVYLAACAVLAWTFGVFGS